MPRLWTETIEEHRKAVRDATLDTTAKLVAERGLRAVTMSEIAERTGIGRATLYKYFPDVDAILLAWHERHIADHLERLIELRDQQQSPGQRLNAVLEAYALLQHEQAAHDGTELAAQLHKGEHLAHAREHLNALIRDLIAGAAATGDARDDITPDELANYCLHALGAAGNLSSKAAVHRLVSVTLTGLKARSRT